MHEPKHAQWEDYTLILVGRPDAKWYANVYCVRNGETHSYLKTGYGLDALRKELAQFDAPAELIWKSGYPE